MDYSHFLNPAKNYREVPFWSWNDDLNPQELLRQIGMMDEAGWGGFFMHSRVGLKTTYLGKKWMEYIRVCAAEAGQRGMGAWLYDEDKWPSGFAGGLAVVNPEHRSQVLVCLVDQKPALLPESLGAWTAFRQDGLLEGFTLYSQGEDFDGDTHSLVQCYPLRASLGVTWFNGYCYIDLLNPDAVHAFIDSTHEAYAHAAPEFFGNAIPGLFTDEPAYMSANFPDIGVVEPGQLQAVPWTGALPELFERRWGYSLLPHLVQLFFDTGDYPRVRYHFWRLVTEQFVESFSKQVYDWCEAHHLQLTGHYLLEDSLWFETRWNGAVMPHYEYEHVPGIDKLARNLFTPLTVKQVDSAACQLGKPRLLCESYGAAGQELSFAGRKWIGDWLYVLGVNLNNPHLALYSMRGERKRDHPANLYFQQPWWGENRLVADYFARLSYILSQGQRVVDILVLHPIGSAWTRYRPDSLGRVGELDERLVELEKTLLSAQRDFHYGDELLMEKYARVAAGEKGPLFEIGKMSYRLVIVPPSYSWTAHTLRLLDEFTAAGGAVLAVPPLPAEIEGTAAETVLPAAVRVAAIADLPASLDKLLPYDVRAASCPDIWAHHRREGQTDWVFLANTSLEKEYNAVVEINARGRVEEWDAQSGAVRSVSLEAGDTTRVPLQFAPGGSHLLIVQRDQPPQLPAVVGAKPERTISVSPPWSLELHDHNALTLDRAAVSVNGSDWSAPLYILDAHQRVARQGAGAKFSLRYSFEVAAIPPGEVFLAVEAPEKLQVSVNDRPVAQHEAGWWIDPSFHKLPVTGLLRPGQNDVLVSGSFDSQTELESIYLVGNFGAAVEKGQYEGGSSGQVFYRYPPRFAVHALPPAVEAADLVQEGLPFFAGRVKLSGIFHMDKNAGPVIVRLGEPRLAAARLRLNGRDCGWAAWAPWEWDASQAVQPGENRIELELVNTLRNLLGPHHLRGGDGEGVGPASFRLNPNWTDDFMFVPFGFKSVYIILRQ